jgi:homoserine dehydrogenase
MNLALIGFGTVGQGFAQLLRDKAADARFRSLDAHITVVVTRSRGALALESGLDSGLLLDAMAAGGLHVFPDLPGLRRDVTALDAVTLPGVDVVLDVTPSNLQNGHPSVDLGMAALAAGKHLVLANKGALVHGFERLNAAARASGRKLLYEATVMAGTPALRLAMQALAGCTLLEARGIVNGTTNYMLTQMQAGLPYAEALAEAQRLGYAEPDPTADVDGWDAASKAVILGAALFGRQFALNAMEVSGISHLTPGDIAAATAAGECWKLIARVTADGAWVRPTRIPLTHPLAGVAGPTNALTLTTDVLGDVTIIGKGAGGLQTGFGLLSDLLDIARSR